MKTLEQLKKLNDRNLLAYYKAERKRFFKFISKHTCECCGELSWHLNSKMFKIEQEEHKQKEQYLDLIKSELNTRAHIPR